MKSMISKVLYAIGMLLMFSITGMEVVKQGQLSMQALAIFGMGSLMVAVAIAIPAGEIPQQFQRELELIRRDNPWTH